MRILYVDDDRSSHINFCEATRERVDISQLKCVFSYQSAVVYAKYHEVDCAFLDIDLQDGSGILLAEELRGLRPNIEVAFITGHDDYAREAYKVGGRAYLSKPYYDNEINDVLTLMEKLVHPPTKMKDDSEDESSRIYLKTFGMFDLILDGYPVHFKNAKAKELLAFLAQQMGGTVTNTQIFFALWEKQEYTQATSTYVRRTVRALKEELDKLGISEILITERNCISLDFKNIRCDAIELLNGNAKAIYIYNGEYMMQYSWGESMIPLLDRVVNNIE